MQTYKVDKELKTMNVSSRAITEKNIYTISGKLSLVSGYPNDPYIWRPTVFKAFWDVKVYFWTFKDFLNIFLQTKMFYKQNPTYQPLKY